MAETTPDLVRDSAVALHGMYDEASGLFSYSTRVVDGRYVNTFEGPSTHRYTINTLAGIQRAAAHHSIGWDVEATLERFLARQSKLVDNVGDRGLLLHVLATAGHDDQDRLLGGIEAATAGDRGGRHLNLQEICWVILGLVTYAERRSSERAQALGGRLLRLIAADYGKPSAPLPDFTVARWRRGFVSFGGVAYYLMALARYAIAFDDTAALERFRVGTNVVTGLQGPNGEWPWFIDARHARVLDWYQVYSVHQDAMSMLFLLPALDLGLPGTSETIERSLSWIHGANELGVDMVQRSPFLIWRSIRRRERHERAKRYVRSSLPAAHGRRLDPGKLEVNRECRSYELGWILFAWAGRTEARAAGASARSWSVARAPMNELESYLDRFVREREAIRVLEAGCGRRASFDYTGAERVVGIDESVEQLANNDWADEKIVGDVQTHPLDDDEFDLVVCWDVLEHLPNPMAALDNLARAVKPDGIIVLGLPNVASVEGLVTRFTPLRFHVWFFRVVRKSKRAGKTGEGPFPTYLRWSLRASSLRAWATSRGLRIELLDGYESPIQQSLRREYKLEGRRWRALQSGVRVLTAGQVVADPTDFAIVLTPDRRQT